MTRMNVTWTRVSQQRMDLLSVGTARVSFKVLGDGHVSELMVASNSGNQALADASLLTVQRTRIPPIPRAALAELPHGYMLGDYQFTVYPQR